MLGGAIDDIIGAVNPHAVILGGYLGVLSSLPAAPAAERLAHRLAIAGVRRHRDPGPGGTRPRTVSTAPILAARDACFYDPLALTRPLR